MAFSQEKKGNRNKKKTEGIRKLQYKRKEKRKKTLELTHLITGLTLILDPFFFFIFPSTIGIGIDTLSPPFPQPHLVPLPSSQIRGPDDRPERDESTLEIEVDIDVEVPPSVDLEMIALFQFAVSVPLTPPAVEVPPCKCE